MQTTARQQRRKPLFFSDSTSASEQLVNNSGEAAGAIGRAHAACQ